MAKIKNVKFKTGRLYTITFTDKVRAFVEYIYFKNDTLYFRVIGHTKTKSPLLYKGKIITAKKEHLTQSSLAIRNMTKAEQALYG